MIPTLGYIIRYHREPFNQPRRAPDGFPAYEFPHRFLVYRPQRSTWAFSLGIRVSIEAFEDEWPKLVGDLGEAKATWLLLRWATKQIEHRLRDGSIDDSTESLELELSDFDLLRQIASEKNCDYQVKESRDLFCSASFDDDPGRLAKVGLKTLAWTSRHHCDECLMPDRDFLCSHLSHPKVELTPAVALRSPRSAVCARNQPNIKNPASCYPGGHECWEWILSPGVDDRPAKYASPALTQAIDLLDAVWRLRFGKSRALVKLSSATAMANLEMNCLTQEQFQARLVALGDVFQAMDIPPDLVDDKQVVGTLNRLKAAIQKTLQDDADRQLALDAIDVLHAAIALRRTAAHGGAKTRVESLNAQQKLAINYYPHASWSDTWDQLRARIAGTLGTIATSLRKGI